jgi:phage tail protein X
MRNYTTTQGDMWDSIAYQMYKDESLMHILIDANPQHRNTVIFPANCELVIPDVSTGVKIDYTPWRRNA